MAPRIQTRTTHTHPSRQISFTVNDSFSLKMTRHQFLLVMLGSSSYFTVVPICGYAVRRHLWPGFGFGDDFGGCSCHFIVRAFSHWQKEPDHFENYVILSYKCIFNDLSGIILFLVSKLTHSPVLWIHDWSQTPQSWFNESFHCKSGGSIMSESHQWSHAEICCDS